MKKLMLILTSILVILSGCDYERSSEPGKIIEVTYKEYEEMIKKDETFMVLISQTNCSHCIAYKKDVLNVYLPTHGFTIYELNVTNEEDPYGVFNTLKEEIGESFGGTPMTLVYKNKALEWSKAGVLSEDELEDVVTKYRLDEK